MQGRHRTWWLAGTIVTAVVALVVTSAGLLIFDPRSTGADALRTGGLAGASIVALYGLWLNDRRRRVQEERHALDRTRQEQDRERVADERFARAVELLGNEADQVRVGALHSLAGLARNRPDYAQTVLDVLCSYLQRPFAHPRYDGRNPATSEGDDVEWTGRSRHDSDRKLQVRLTAQRLIAALLPAAGQADAPAYDLDLTGATLEYFDLSHKRIGRLVVRYARLFSSNTISHCEILGPAFFTGTTIGSGRLEGRFRCHDTDFHERAWFGGIDFHGPVWFDRTRFHGRTKFANSTFHRPTSMVDAVFEGPVDLDRSWFADDLDMSSTTWNGDVRASGMIVNTARTVTLPKSWTAPPDSPEAPVTIPRGALKTSPASAEEVRLS